MHSDIWIAFCAFPKKLETIIVKMPIVERLAKFFVHHRDQRTMVEISYDIVFGARVSHSAMKWHRDADRCPLPPCILVHPFCITTINLVKRISGQCFVDVLPICMPHVCWPELFVPNDCQKLLKALLGLLDPTVPIPVTEEESTLVRKRSKRLLEIGRLYRYMLQTFLIVSGLWVVK
jgi:hypothetical protein